jgi:hypothetical protein
MPDQLFDSLTDDVTVRPLPAAEVRRRGDRRRIRQQAAIGVAGLAAVAAIAVPMALTHGSTDRSTPSIATGPTPSPAAVTMVPANFPLTAGMPHAHTLETLPLTTDEETACGTVVWGATRPIPTVDGATVSYHDASEGGETRSIALYALPERAASALRTIESTLASCGSVDDGSGKVTRLRSATAADPTDVWVIRWTDENGQYTGEGMISSATVVGNALLLDSATFMSAGDDAIVQQEAARVTGRSAAVVAAMCVFSAQPCDQASTAPSSSSDASTVLGPTGYGRLRIGMTYDEALATGEIGPATTDGGGLQIAAHPDASLCLDEKDGLMAIFLGAGMRTPEGVHHGSTVAELESAYPDLRSVGPDGHVGGPGIFRADAADGLWYEIDVNQNLKVGTVILRQDHQTCFE